jgi:hypothetical protein
MKVQIIIFLLIIILILSTCLIIILKIALNKNYTIKIGGTLDEQISSLINETNSLLINANKSSLTNIRLDKKLKELLTTDFFINAEKSFKAQNNTSRTIYQHIMYLILKQINTDSALNINATPNEYFKAYIYDIYKTMNYLKNFTPEQMPNKTLVLKREKKLKEAPKEALKEAPKEAPKKNQPKHVKKQKTPIQFENTLLPTISDDIPRITSFDEFLKLEDKDAEIELCNNEKQLLSMDIEELDLKNEELAINIEDLHKAIKSRDKEIELCDEANKQLKHINTQLNITNWNMESTNSLLTNKNIDLESELDHNNSFLHKNRFKLDSAERVINENTTLKMDIQNSKLRYEELYNILNKQREIIEEQDSELQEQDGKIQKLSIYQNDVQMSRALAETTSENNKSLKLENAELKSKLLENVASENVFLDRVQKENIELKLELNKLNNGIDRTLIQLKKNPLIVY